ncbi:MAG: transposase [Desulfamplus sp.]|nr:transposase [Desulfamplus sp.]
MNIEYTGKKHHHVNYTARDIRLSKRREHEQSPEFKDKYRYRSGVEATMSQYDRRTGVKLLRVRGLKAVRYCAVMKAAALNIFRAAMVSIARNRANMSKLSTNCSLKSIIKVFKELFGFFEAYFCCELLAINESASS